MVEVQKKWWLPNFRSMGWCASQMFGNSTTSLTTATLRHVALVEPFRSGGVHPLWCPGLRFFDVLWSEFTSPTARDLDA